MAINNVGNAGQKPQLESQKLNQQQQAQAQVANNQKAQTAAPKQDSVSLTQSAQQLTNVQKKGTDAPINQDKVDRLKKAIQSGEYRINPEALASKIAKLESEMFGLAKN